MIVSRLACAVASAAAVVVLGSACGTQYSTLPHIIQVDVDSTIPILLSANDSAALAVRMRRSGFTGDLTLSVEGLPPSVHADTVRAAAGQTSANLELVADSLAASDSTELTVRAVAHDGTTGTARRTLVLTGVSSFDFRVGVDSVTLVPGVADTLDVVIDRQGDFTGEVSFTSGGVPPGMSVTFVPDTVAESTSRLLLSADTTVATDTAYAVTLTGAGQGAQDVTDTLYVTVSSAAAVPGLSPSAAASVGPSAVSTPRGRPQRRGP